MLLFGLQSCSLLPNHHLKVGCSQFLPIFARIWVVLGPHSLYLPNVTGQSSRASQALSDGLFSFFLKSHFGGFTIQSVWWQFWAQQVLPPCWAILGALVDPHYHLWIEEPRKCTFISHSKIWLWKDWAETSLKNSDLMDFCLASAAQLQPKSCHGSNVNLLTRIS